MPQIYDMGPTALLPLRRKACWGFFRPKNPTASTGFEPSNLGTKGQHATPRPPKPIDKLYTPDNTVVLGLLYPYRIITLGATKACWGTSTLFCKIYFTSVSTHPSIHPSVYPSSHPSFHLSTCPFINLSISLLVCLHISVVYCNVLLPFCVIYH